VARRTPPAPASVGTATPDLLTVGGPTGVVRIGDTVHRTTGPWSPAVHRLLDHVRDKGFHGAPRYHGTDPSGREILDYIAGAVLPSPLPDGPAWDRVIATVGATLRAYHDATASLAEQSPAGWQFDAVRPIEVVCHNDIAPDNTVLREDGSVAFIDFDTAGPGPRAWDLAYALYRFAPLSQGGGDPLAQGRRARLLLDGYGANPADRVATIRLVPERLEVLAAFIEAQAAAGHPAYGHHVADGHADLYRRDAAYARSQATTWELLVVT